MGIYDSMVLIRDRLRQGMSDSEEEYYVKTWYINDPIALDLSKMPIAVIKPDDDSRSDQYVQEDTATDDIIIHFFPTPIKRVRGAAEDEGPSKQAEMMVDEAIALIRMEPTFGNQFVYDVKVLGSTFKQPGFVGDGVFHAVELRVQAKRRAPWIRNRE